MSTGLDMTGSRGKGFLYVRRIVRGYVGARMCVHVCVCVCGWVKRRVERDKKRPIRKIGN